MEKNSRWNYLYTKVGNVNVDQHWEYPRETVDVLATLPKAVLF
jgi:hypothetical protein